MLCFLRRNTKLEAKKTTKLSKGNMASLWDKLQSTQLSIEGVTGGSSSQSSKALKDASGEKKKEKGKKKGKGEKKDKTSLQN